MSLGGADVPRRVIIHVDLDAFYAQVEQNRLGIPRETPCAVQQWEALIAVNYAARARGVTRHMRASEAKKACPELKLVHVRTIGSGGTEEQETEGTARSRGTAKACLQRYRQASGEIMRLLQGMLTRGCPFEKGGLDEMFMDVTAMAEAELSVMMAGSGLPQAAGSDAPASEALADASSDALADSALSRAFSGVEASSTVVGGPLLLDNSFDRLMVAGTLIAQRMRKAIFDELHMTCSAGVAYNKILAKLGSSLHKPNKQALVLPRGALDMMQPIPVAKIWGLGGKLGTALEQHFGATTAGQAQLISLPQLSRVMDAERAVFVYERVRGQSRDAVVPKCLIKSINSCKSFAATSDLASVAKWMDILAQELAQRLADDEAEHCRRARTLSLHYTTGGGAWPHFGGRPPQQAHAERSVRCHMPQHGREGPSAAAISASAMATFRKLQDALPCIRLALSAADFSAPGSTAGAAGGEEAAVAAGTVGSGRSIASFFAAASAKADAAGVVAEGGAGAGTGVGAGAGRRSIASFFVITQPKKGGSSSAGAAGAGSPLGASSAVEEGRAALQDAAPLTGDLAGALSVAARVPESPPAAAPNGPLGSSAATLPPTPQAARWTASPCRPGRVLAACIAEVVVAARSPPGSSLNQYQGPLDAVASPSHRRAAEESSIGPEEIVAEVVPDSPPVSSHHVPTAQGLQRIQPGSERQVPRGEAWHVEARQGEGASPSCRLDQPVSQTSLKGLGWLGGPQAEPQARPLAGLRVLGTGGRGVQGGVSAGTGELRGRGGDPEGQVSEALDLAHEVSDDLGDLGAVDMAEQHRIMRSIEQDRGMGCKGGGGGGQRPLQKRQGGCLKQAGAKAVAGKRQRSIMEMFAPRPSDVAAVGEGRLPVGGQLQGGKGGCLARAGRGGGRRRA